jgi:hypothetical protein
MPPRVRAATVYTAACLAFAPAAPGQAAPATATVHIQPVSAPSMQQTLATAQTMSVKPPPAAAAAMHAKLSPMLSAPARGWVQSEAKVIAGRNLGASAMRSMAQNDAKSRFAGQGLSSMDVEDLAMLVMMTVSQDAQNDLKSQLEEMQKESQQKQAQRAAAQAQKQQQAAMKDSLKKHEDQLGDISQEQQMKLQMYMDRMSKAEQELSKMEKQQSATASSILGNLK